MIAFKEHASSQFDTELNSLLSMLEKLKSHLHKFIALVILSAEDGKDRGQEARTIDKAVNELEFEIDQQVMRLISKFSPMADELRLVLAVVKIAGACESAADKLKNTVKRVAKLGGLKKSSIGEPFLAMLNRTADQFDIVLEKFSQLDDAAMKKILAEREEIHALYKQALTGCAGAGEDVIGHSFLLRNIERISELAYDIAKIGYAAKHNRKFEKPEFLA